MKTCNRCGAFGDLFTRNAASPDGYYSICRDCRSKTRRAYSERPEVAAKEKARLSASYQARKTEIDGRRRERYALNREATLAKNREWRARNLERHRELCRAWARDNPDTMRGIVAKRRAIKAMAEGVYSSEHIADMRKRQDGKCRYCACDLESFHVDHIVPLSRGGSNWPENLQLLCPACNLSKGNKLPSEFEEYRASA